MDEKEFQNIYQSIKFKENPSDCFSLASVKRQTLLLNFYRSIQSKESNIVTEFLLNEDLNAYAKIVDNREEGQVNNYADFVLAHQFNYHNDDKKNWKSHLNQFDVREHIRNLPCSNDINCKYSHLVSEDGLQELKNAVQRADDDEERQEPVKAQPVHQHTTRPQLERSKSLDQYNFQPKFPRQMPKAVKPDEANAGHMRHEPGIGFQPKPEPVHFKNYSRNDSVHVKQPNTDTFYSNGNSRCTKIEEPEQSNNFSVFRTARDELQIQNAKKFGKGGGGGGGGGGGDPEERQYNYGAVKKSLGTRKGGVFSKFQPPIKSRDNSNEGHGSSVTSMDVDEVVDERLKNIDPKMIELIKNEIMDCGSNVTWDDIAGLQLAKNTIQEIVVWPMLRPDIFTGLRRPPKGILLFGPPGTGKTLIGKCIASQSNSTFFSISASSLTSKWVGDGEKMVRTLFAVAKVHQPSVVFIDEIDSLLSQRSDSEHECSRRIKTEFLVQLDGAGTGDEDRILIIGATNRPQELDEAARRRLVKRLYIPLPDEDARRQIIENLIASERHCLTESDIDRIAKLTRGYSGADVKNLCQEASLGPIRSIAPSMIQCINPNEVRPLNSKDFESALSRIKSSVSDSDLDIYVAWDKQYGCGSASQSQ